MKKSMIKTVMTGTFASILAVGLALPGSASAASNQTCNYTDINVVLQEWAKNHNVNGGNWKVIVVDKTQTTIKPTTPEAKPEAKPEVKPEAKPEAKPQAKPETKPETKPVTTPETNTTTTDKSSVAAQVVDLVNQERTKAGLKALTIDSKLANMALDKAKDMSNNNYFDHNSPTYGSPFDMMKTYGISYSYAGENIAKGQKTPADVMNSWMNSAGHRANILSPNFTTIGVGFYNGHWVQEFISK